jgi:hypothetical protein
MNSGKVFFATITVGDMRIRRSSIPNVVTTREE